MNYSASENYNQKCCELQRKEISKTKIKRRLFRNFYVLYQSTGYFTHNYFAFHVDLGFHKKYNGEFYGPFWTKEGAREFGRRIVETHESFVLG
jgi:hypothetical protein